jgi:FkbM family methyltransferase
MQKIILLIIDFFDYFHKKKILDFLKKNNYKEFSVFFDIGAHKGETIDLFTKNFNVENFYSFEASPINYKILKKNILKYKNKNITLENIAIGSNSEKAVLKQVQESSSSTLSNINVDSKYFKKKKRVLNFFSKKKYYQNINVEIKTLYEYLNLKLIKNIDFLKIDTEGYEFNVLLGLKDKLQNVKIVLFEHHYDDMLKKGYTFTDINALLVKHNFKQIYKTKMPFRKTFEYIYINKKIS